VKIDKNEECGDGVESEQNSKKNESEEDEEDDFNIKVDINENK
jgi:hypothetical protein